MRCSITAGVSTSAIQGMFECHAVNAVILYRMTLKHPLDGTSGNA